jgi:hypothetical protein
VVRGGWSTSSPAPPGITPQTRTTRCCRRPPALGIPVGAIKPQRQGLLEPRLLRHGLPDQRQAVDAGDDHPAALTAGATSCTPRCAPSACCCRAAASGPRLPAMHAAGIHALRAGCRCGAKHFVLAAGAIGSPALLLRSGARPAAAARPAHLPAPGGDLVGADATSASRGYAGAPQTIYSDHFPAPGADRRTRSASSSKRRRCTRCSMPRPCRASARRMRKLMREFTQRQRAAGAAARRLPSRQPRRPGAARRRRPAGARLPDHDVIWEACAAPAGDGRDPVRRRRAQAGDAGARDSARLCELGGGQERDRRAAAESPSSAGSSART